MQASQTQVVRALKGGPPVSPSAMKGFAFAWLLPRVVIVIGSLVGVVVLAFQTYIIWSQTELLRYQSQAAQTERAEQLRLRIARTENHGAALAVMEDAFAAAAYANAPPCDESCKATNLFAALGPGSDGLVTARALPTGSTGSSGRPTRDKRAAEGSAMRVQHLKERLERAQRTVSESLPPPGPASAGPMFAPAQQLVRDAGLECFGPTELSQRINVGLRLVSQVIRVLNAEELAGLDEPVALMILSRGKTLPYWPEMRTNGRYTVGTFSDDVIKFLRDLEDHVQDLKDLCAAKAKADRATLLIVSGKENISP